MRTRGAPRDTAPHAAPAQCIEGVSVMGATLSAALSGIRTLRHLRFHACWWWSPDYYVAIEQLDRLESLELLWGCAGRVSGDSARLAAIVRRLGAGPLSRLHLSDYAESRALQEALAERHFVPAADHDVPAGRLSWRRQ